MLLQLCGQASLALRHLTPPCPSFHRQTLCIQDQANIFPATRTRLKRSRKPQHQNLKSKANQRSLLKQMVQTMESRMSMQSKMAEEMNRCTMVNKKKMTMLTSIWVGTAIMAIITMLQQAIMALASRRTGKIPFLLFHFQIAYIYTSQRLVVVKRIRSRPRQSTAQEQQWEEASG